MAYYWLDFDHGIIYKMWSEFIGCMMFHFIGSVSATPWANGLALTFLVFFLAKISGSHLNPSVSLSFMLLGHIQPYELVAYCISQLAGCVFGALWIAALVPSLHIGVPMLSSDLHYSGCFIPNPNISNAQIFGWEAVCTFCFICPIFAVVWYTQTKSGYGNTGPLIIGFSLIANAIVDAPFTGAALNPARVLASPIIFKCPSNKTLIYYICGELVAGLCVPILIIPWYGLSINSWYYKYFPCLKRIHSPIPINMKTSIELPFSATNKLKTLADKMNHVSPYKTSSSEVQIEVPNSPIVCATTPIQMRASLDFPYYSNKLREMFNDHNQNLDIKVVNQT